MIKNYGRIIGEGIKADGETREDQRVGVCSFGNLSFRTGNC